MPSAAVRAGGDDEEVIRLIGHPIPNPLAGALCLSWPLLSRSPLQPVARLAGCPLLVRLAHLCSLTRLDSGVALPPCCRPCSLG
eukprot:3284485-Prymnesium_polylepis.1